MTRRHDPNDPTPAVCCEECGRELEIVCPKGHKNPMERRRKSKGPVPPAPQRDERAKKLRQCSDCPAELPKGSKLRRCATCTERVVRERNTRYCLDCKKPIELGSKRRRCEACRAIPARIPKPEKILTPEQARQKEIGALIRRTRGRLGLSPADLAAKIDRSPGSFSVWETGGAVLGPAIIPALAKVLGLREKDLTNELLVKGHRRFAPREKAAA